MYIFYNFFLYISKHGDIARHYKYYKSHYIYPPLQFFMFIYVIYLVYIYIDRYMHNKNNILLALCIII